MPEYIDKLSVVNRLIDLENEFQQYKPFNGFEHAMYRKLCEAEIAIGKTSAADVAQVRHGRWIKKQEKDTFAGYLYSYECSACGRVEQCKEPYCNCGAKMDGGESHA